MVSAAPLQPAARPPYGSIAVVSATALAYEVLLTRLFSIVQWHHFAYMVISIALLGFGASGTFLALRSHLLQRYTFAYIANLVWFGISVMPCFLLAQRFAVHPEQLLWDPLQMLGVTLVYVLLALPFFFAANAIGLTLMRCGRAVTQVYAADLAGAGAGSIAIVACLYLMFPTDALKLLGVLGLFAAWIAAWELNAGGRTLRFTAIAALTLPGALLLLPGHWFSLAMSPYKSLAQQMNVIGARVEAVRSSPLGVLHVVASPTVPLRHAPGLSFNTTATVPEQRAVFIDGDGLTPIDAGGPRSHFAYLDALTSALPYHLGTPQQVLILGAGGGSLVRQALYHGVPSVTAVELDAQIVALMRGAYRDFSGGLYDLNTVTVHVDEAREFLARQTRRYDLMQVALVDSFAASSAGLHALNEDYLHTVEALGAYYAQLNEGGYLAISRWIKLPPRDTLKLFATAVEALRRAGVADPTEHLLLIRGWQTSTLIVKRGRFTRDELDRARYFCEERSFDLGFYAGMPAVLSNRYNILPQPYLYEGARALLGATAQQFMADYKFNIEPATDDRPYFSYFFKWRTLPEIAALRGRGGIPLLESGYLVLIATLAQAVLISATLILLPLLKRMRAAGVRRRRLSGYFTALGLGFLFVEIAFIQKFVLFLHHPVLAVAAVLSGFLVFAGLGSYLARRWSERMPARRLVRAAIGVVVVLGSGYALVLPDLVFTPLTAAPLAIKLPVSLAFIALLAIPMGMPFPLGIARLTEFAPALIPAAWAINGCASVVSAVLATVLAIHFGFTAVVLLAVGLYLLAAATFEF